MAIRDYYGNNLGGSLNDKIVVNKEKDPKEARPFSIFVERLKEKLELSTLEEAKSEVLRPQRAVDIFIDQNDLLVELINMMVANGLWTYDVAAKVLFLQQINVGVVDGKVMLSLTVDATLSISVISLRGFLQG